MRDFLPADVRRRTYVIGVIRGVYERYGFEPLETPAVENIETLLGKYGDEGNQLIFKILKRGEHEASGQADLALRYDLTVPLSRVVAEHRATLPKFFKRYQIQPVWRADRPARGRFREFFQCDVDAMGSTSPVVEAELCAAACEAMQALGFTDAVLRLNHRAVLTGVLDVAGVPTEQAWRRARRARQAGQDRPRRREGRVREAGAVARVADTVLGILGSAAVSGAVAADNAVALDRVEAFVAGHEAAVAGIANMREVLALAARTPAGRPVARGPQPGARPLVLHRLHHGDDGPGPGRQSRRRWPLRRPGRHVPRPAVPAAGFSLGLERILVVMGERAMFPAHITATAADVLIAQWNAATRRRRAGAGA